MNYFIILISSCIMRNLFIDIYCFYYSSLSSTFISMPFSFWLCPLTHSSISSSSFVELVSPLTPRILNYFWSYLIVSSSKLAEHSSPIVGKGEYLPNSSRLARILCYLRMTFNDTFWSTSHWFSWMTSSPTSKILSYYPCVHWVWSKSTSDCPSFW